MGFGIEFAPSARSDLHDLVAYIAADNSAAAEKFGHKIFRSIEGLAKSPRMGRIVPEFGQQDLREIIVNPYRIVYRINEASATLQVVRIWHAARGVPGL